MKEKLENILKFVKVGILTKRELLIYSSLGVITVAPVIATSINLPPEIAEPVKASAELITEETNTIDILLMEPGVLNVSPFNVKHEEGAHERIDPLDEAFFPFTPSPCVDLSSSPYPYDTPLSYDKRNKRSTLPIYMSAVLRGITSSNGSLYFIISGYGHRNLTIQEVNPLDPENPNNPNPIKDIRALPTEYGMYKYDAGTFEEGVERMFRVGVYTKLRGDIDENGQVDFDDIKLSGGENWLHTTHDSNDNYVGNNYHVGDRNHDGWNDFLDFAIIGEDWWQTEAGGPISKVFTPE